MIVFNINITFRHIEKVYRVINTANKAIAHDQKRPVSLTIQGAINYIIQT